MENLFTRRSNASDIFHAIRKAPGISQREIVLQTGFDKSTVSSIIGAFHDADLVEEVERPAQNRRGRPSKGLRVSQASGILVGVRIEADEVRFVGSALDGKPRFRRACRFDGSVDDMQRIFVREIDAIASDPAAGSPLLAVGVSVPGLLRADGVLVHLPVLGWRDVALLDRLASAVKAPVFVGNDGKAGAMAERMFGAGKDGGDFIYLFSGSGVGGAMVLDGQVYAGADGLAGELGHIKIVPQGRFCSCGASGCLSAYLSEPALCEEIGRLSGDRPEDFATLRARAEAGDPSTLTVLESAGDVLGTAVSSLMNIFNPNMVLLGGDLSLARPWIEAPMMRALQRLAHPAMAERTGIRFSELSAQSPFLGGVALALDGVTGRTATNETARMAGEADNEEA
ncbi:ROK family transcriptional regulator [Psychromarinibacter sp. C21-152]|uniref:ROK family transcriptional regulator n=1 Tax=Psychromarinibacter sediminicola TaxID=3033385 RepID=A0AAE3T6N9_9RHOB|nr:ROK family transcriptional regulator [Psychromarinibacter sediminicola]MDF0599467.1 ROK family transcriptional regulator [Psychromarinibacter sediminicola]